ncbi:DUF975 family protein [Pseudoflavonifractor phocaeensis]|uniref:DUF975 family protein n=1 Tax=Pseudoflavonifractor phocaeensis TaxID=1870988 RepID=UPI00195D138C|nr:DUF975 family protein [Pseudoflavonifractor phocaeensis]MBM6925350.1 DUF975 family protein [Pseudoflavonifractor phocaeensis]
MGYNRPQSKWMARSAMRGAYPHPMLVALVYIALTTVLGNIIMSFVSNPFEAVYYYLLETNYSVEQILRAILTPQRVMVVLAMELLLTLYYWVMGYGYSSYCLRLARREGPGYRNLLDGFWEIGRALSVNLLSALFVLLWSLVGVAVYVATIVISVIMGFPLPMLLGGVFLLVWTIRISYRYRLAVYFLLDNPGMGALEALTNSKQAMDGHTLELFVQDLSFLGWALLTPFTLGILLLWLAPYAGTADANFYHWVMYGSLPGGPEPTQPIW